MVTGLANEALYRLPECRIWQRLAPVLVLVVAPLIRLDSHHGGALVFFPDHFRWCTNGHELGTSRRFDP